MNAGGADKGAAARGLLWQLYALPTDASGWLLALVRTAESLPACVVVSDMSLPGNPMVYVNPAFCQARARMRCMHLARDTRLMMKVVGPCR